MAPFRSRNTGFNASSSSSFSSLPLSSSWDRSDSDSDSKKVREASEQALEKQSAISRLRRPSSSMAKSRLPKKRVIRDERRGWFSEERDEMSISNRDRDNALSTSLSNPRMSLRRGEDET